jgi:cytoskeletal protein CcmA (bactofilin family)
MAEANSGMGGQRVGANSLRANLNSANAQPAGNNVHPSWVEERARVAVNRNVRIAGRLVFQEPIRIEGHFRGEVSSSELVVIAEGGSVGGRVRSPRLVILGELEGDITDCRSVVLGPRSKFKGKLEADNVTIFEGACLNADVRIGCRADAGQSDDASVRHELQ